MPNDDLSIPAFLRREVTPQTKAAGTRLNNELRRGAYQRRVESSGRSTISTGHAANLDEAGRQLLKEVRKAEHEAKRERLAKLRELRKGKAMSKQVTGSKEQALRQARESEAKHVPPAKATATNGVSVAATVGTTPTQPTPEAKTNGATPPKESDVRTTKTSKKASKANARKAVKDKTSSVRPGTKLAIVAGLLSRKNGCTAAEVLKATGWPAVSMPQQAKAAGLKLKKEKVKGEPTRYFAA